MPRNLLLALGVMVSCGLACTSASWLMGLTAEARAQLIGQGLMAWFCCGGPLAGGVAGWYLNQWRRQGWRRAPMEEL